MVNNEQIREDAKFCLELMKRLEKSINAKTGCFYETYCVDGYTQIEADIIRLRRELLILKAHVREEEDV